MQAIKRQTNHPEVLSLTSLTAPEFMQLLSVFGPLCEHYFQHHDRAANRLEGNPRSIPKFTEDERCSLPGSYQKLFFLLTSLKENPRQHYHAQLFNMKQPWVSKWVAGRWVKLLLPLLEKALSKLKRLPKRFGYELYAFLLTFRRFVLLMDATARRPGERPIPRSVDYGRQKHEYSHRGAAARRKPTRSRTISL